LKDQGQKKMVTQVLNQLEKLLHGAIDDGRTGNLNVFEMIMVSADTLNNVYKTKKTEKKGTANNVVQLRKN